MTNFSSFDMPVARADVTVIVAIFGVPQIVVAKLARPCADLLGRINPWALANGNIAVKAAPIRLSALTTTARDNYLNCGADASAVWVILRRTNVLINRFHALNYCALACALGSGENPPWNCLAGLIDAGPRPFPVTSRKK